MYSKRVELTFFIFSFFSALFIIFLRVIYPLNVTLCNVAGDFLYFVLGAECRRKGEQRTIRPTIGQLNLSNVISFEMDGKKNNNNIILCIFFLLLSTVSLFCKADDILQVYLEIQSLYTSAHFSRIYLSYFFFFFRCIRVSAYFHRYSGGSYYDHNNYQMLRDCTFSVLEKRLLFFFSKHVYASELLYIMVDPIGQKGSELENGKYS